MSVSCPLFAISAGIATAPKAAPKLICPGLLLARRTAITPSGCDAMTSREKSAAPWRKLTRAIASSRFSDRRYCAGASALSKLSLKSGRGRVVPKEAGRPSRYFWHRSRASAYFSANSSCRIWARCSSAPGLTSLVLGAPDHAVDSESAMRSFVAPPKTMPPSRPLPIGSAPSQRSAGRAYHSSSCELPSTDNSIVELCGRAATAIPTCRNLRLVVCTTTPEAIYRYALEQTTFLIMASSGKSAGRLLSAAQSLNRPCKPQYCAKPLLLQRLRSFSRVPEVWQFGPAQALTQWGSRIGWLWILPSVGPAAHATMDS